jgi:hypothetical protein
MVFATITLSLGLSAAQSAPKSETKVHNNFKVNWSSITYKKSLKLRNPAVAKGRQRELVEGLSISCQIEVLEPSRVLGLCREPIIEKIIDDKGKSVEIGSVSRGSGDMKYDLLRYRRRSVRTSPRLKNAIRSALGLRRKTISRPKWFKELESSGMQINLDVELSKQPGEKIARVEGHFYALVTESLEYVDVPFKRSDDDWVRLTPDMEIRLPNPWCEESRYRLQIRARPDEDRSTASFHVHRYLPNRLLVERRVLGPDDKLIDHPTAIRGLPRLIIDECAVYGGKGLGQIEKVRFVIAVNPTHYEIPFVLENIPLPRP